MQLAMSSHDAAISQTGNSQRVRKPDIDWARRFNGVICRML
jgi:hypothetical protein